MKTLSMTLIGTLLSMSLFAQSMYEEAMQNALTKYGKAATVEELQASVSQFERISAVETEEWLPAYYASMIYCIITFRTNDPQKKEALLEQSQMQLDLAMKIAPDESEVYTLQGMIYQAFMGINPAEYGQKYSKKANGSFQTAIKLNSENPRPYYLQAISVMYTPEQYGGGKKAALPLFEQAMKLFNESSDENGFYPNWGREDCEKNLQDCQNAQASL